MWFKLLFWLSCAAILGNTDGFDGRPVLRVVGGHDATERFKFMASLQVLTQKKNMSGEYVFSHICGGSIVLGNCIVTAAHCVVNNTYNKFSVFVGSNDLDDPLGERYYLRGLTVHEQYNPGNGKNDIAVLRLNQTMPFSSRIGAISQSTDFIGGDVRLKLIGWGYTDPLDLLKLPRYLQEADVTSLTNKDCENIFYTPTDTDICTSGKKLVKLVGANNGDSGGPLFQVKNNGTALVGVVSRGFIFAGLLADLYTRASLFVSWINTTCAKSDDN